MFSLTVFSSCAKKEAAADGGKALKPFKIPYETTGAGNPLVAVAYDLGYFKEAGLDVDLNILNTEVNADQLMAVTTGKMDIANGGGTTAPLLFIEQGNDIVIIGGTMGEGASLITTAENAPQYADFSVTSLYGKKIGVKRANTGDVALRGWIARNGGDLSRITFVELDSPATILEAVRKGELDAGNIYVNWRQVAESQGFKVVLHIDQVSPNFPCCRIATTRKNIEARRDEYVALLKGLIRAYKVFTEDREKTLDIADAHYDADRELKRSIYYDYGHYTLSPDPASKRVQEFYAGMTFVGYAKGTADIPGHIDTSLYRDALDQILKEYPNDEFFKKVKKEFDENN
jgi:NitT/TauT family transport system substrate-binding protein